MIDGVSANVQALGVLGEALQAVSSNIANASTEGYRPLRVGLADGEGGQGVQVAAVTRQSEASPGGGVDLGSQMVGLAQIDTAYAANATMIRVADETAGTVLNLIA